MNKPRFTRALLAAAITALIWTVEFPSAHADEPATPWEAPARAARKKNPVPSDEASLAAGKAVYVKECQQCHGEKGKGDGPAAKDLKVKPKDLGEEAVTKQSDGALFWKLTEGRAPMPATDKTLSETERWQVINFVRKFAEKS
jgi:mono/diheme cytochrome c family protein